MDSIRTFIAIDIKPNDNLLDIWSDLKELFYHDKIKWVDDRLLHFTLFFLGETHEIKIDTIIQNLDKSLSSIKPFDISLKGFGSFGNPLSPKVLWVGVEQSKELATLKEVVNEAIIPLGFEEDHKEFSPHLTLGRVKDMRPANALKEFIKKHKEVLLQEIEINEVVFYQSILRPEGPSYKPIKVFKLPSP